MAVNLYELSWHIDIFYEKLTDYQKLLCIRHVCAALL